MQRKRFIQAALSVATACVALLGQSSLAAAATVRPLDSLPYEIQGLGSSRCINDPNSSTANGTQMIIYNCSNPNLNMIWGFEALGTDSAGRTIYWIFSANTNPAKCLTVQNASTSLNAPIIQYDCNTNGGGNEEWYVTKKQTQNSHDYYWIQNVHSNMCIAVQNAGTTDGSKLLQYSCNTGTNEEWTWFPVALP